MKINGNASTKILIMNMIWFCQDTNCHSQWHKCYDHEKISKLKYWTWVEPFLNTNGTKLIFAL